MSDYDRGVMRPGIVAAPDMAVDAGLRGFMLGVYNKVALGLVLSAALAWLTGMYPPARAFLFHVDGAGHVGLAERDNAASHRLQPREPFQRAQRQTPFGAPGWRSNDQARE